MNKKNHKFNVPKPSNNIHNKNKPNEQKLFIDFTKHQNWWKSVRIKKHKFTNFYESDRHAKVTLAKVLFDIFPYIQDNIEKIMSGQLNSHCHIVQGEPLGKTWEVINELYPGNRFDKSMEIYQLGHTQGERMFGALISGEDHYIFRPLFIDCNHLIYPSNKHNRKDFKKFNKKIR